MEKKVFLDDLPRKKYGDNGRIVWERSIGHWIRFIYEGIEGKVQIIGYESNEKGKYVCIKYEDMPVLKLTIDSFQKCQIGELFGKRTSKFKFKIGKVFKDEKRDIIITDRKYMENPYNKGKKLKWYKYKCNKCGFECGEHYKNGELREEYWMLEGNFLAKRNGCACCCSSPQITVEGINDIPTTDPWMVKFFRGGYEEAKKYTKCSTVKIKPICPECGRAKNKEVSVVSIHTNKSISCYCGDGIKYPNKFGFNLLEQLNVDFKTEYMPEWIKPKRYDFYFKINNKEYILEMDGGWHKKDNKMSGQTKEESKGIDDYKDKIARGYGIKVIRIKCYESELNYIKNNILESELNDLFDLSKIDWLKVGKFALSNRVKEACEYKKNDSNMTTTEIAKIMKLDKTTIIKYLKKGTELGWCEYNPKERSKKASIKVIKMKGKQVEIFKDGISLGVFKSISELSMQSEKLFGVKLLICNISAACNKKQKKHKGFTFKFI